MSGCHHVINSADADYTLHLHPYLSRATAPNGFVDNEGARVSPSRVVALVGPPECPAGLDLATRFQLLGFFAGVRAGQVVGVFHSGCSFHRFTS